jgi:cysteine desulfurase
MTSGAPAGAGERPVAYFDHASTTPMRPEVLAAMMPWLTSRYGNASGSHSMARAARRAVDDAREVLAEALGGEPGEVVLTSGGTEADNLAVTGAVAAAVERGLEHRAIACSAVEHPAVLEPVRAAGGATLEVDQDGVIDLPALEAWLAAHSDRVVEVSVMLVNNETGVIEPVADVARAVKELAPQAVLHTDAVQALGWLDVASLAAEADLVTVSAHKFGGPKGVGALLVRSSARGKLRPVLRGGPQERELRAGTHDVAGIVGMATAVRLALAGREATTQRVATLAEALMAGITAGVEGAAGAVGSGRRVGAICNVGFDGVESEELLIVLDQLGVCASAGSACASGALEPSHVLIAMGRSPEQAKRHVRYSLGTTTTPGEVDQAVAATIEAVGRLRRES